MPIEQFNFRREIQDERLLFAESDDYDRLDNAFKAACEKRNILKGSYWVEDDQTASWITINVVGASNAVAKSVVLVRDVEGVRGVHELIADQEIIDEIKQSLIFS